MAQDQPSAGQSLAMVNCTLCLANVILNYRTFSVFFFFSCDYHKIMFSPHSDTYSEVVPSDGPPSFRGQAVKYVYKLTIGCQRVNSPIKLLRVPFRVLVLHGRLHFFSLFVCGFPFSLVLAKHGLIFTRQHLRCINISTPVVLHTKKSLIFLEISVKLYILT